ncbi:metallophosphoesterase [Rhodocytophaga rosea]|uniref:Metallophosphoesterase n=2 Tax=Rhodocytophaga rosea TaxID=2704465 RepID=A0A6C0GXG9_9BACT|nr:metallophosphoesterase [Rhodocytophaga rosea]
MLSGLVLTDALWFERFFIEINEFFIGNTDKNQSQIQVVQVSDLHLNSINKPLRKLAQKINKVKPDMVLITGDAIDKSENISLLDDFLKLIDHHIQKVAILGNWEYWGNIDLNRLNDIYKGSNCDLLINETRQYNFRNKTISITGVDDFIGGNADFELAIAKYQQGDFHIVLNHCPQYSDTIGLKTPENIKIDLILSGHTHGGQINLFGIIPFLPQGSGKYVKGWYKNNLKNIYVSKGIGTSILPLRFGARAEIAIFNL